MTDLHYLISFIFIVLFCEQSLHNNSTSNGFCDDALIAHQIECIGLDHATNL